LTVLEAHFLTSAARAADLPHDAAPQVALVGRSNVGKSSLINALAGRRIARTSGTPGKTRLVNLYRVVVAGLTPGAHRAKAGTLYLADLPGYGFARGGEQAQLDFARLTEAYFGAGRLKAAPTSALSRGGPESLGGRVGAKSLGGRVGLESRGGRLQPAHPAAVLLVVDARHPGLASDLDAWRWITSLGRPAAIVATKVDKLGRADRARALAGIARMCDSPVLAVSAGTGEGMDDLWIRIAALVNRKAETANPAGPDR
jgi:GTP-binding protein